MRSLGSGAAGPAVHHVLRLGGVPPHVRLELLGDLDGLQPGRGGQKRPCWRDLERNLGSS